MAYYLQINSKTERINFLVEAFLQYYQQYNWTEWLLAVIFQYNNKKR